MIYKNIKKLHDDDILRLKHLAPFSNAEEALILDNLDSVQLFSSFQFFFILNNILC
jgi:hypothetical protein